MSLSSFGAVGILAIRRIVRRPLMLVPWIIGIVVIGVALQAAIPLEAERLHLVEYGLVGVVCAWAMPRRWSWIRKSVAAVGCTLALGMLEELVQWALPDRVGEWRDVLLDGLGGLVGRYALIPWALRG